jgi:hypothetical protein
MCRNIKPLCNFVPPAIDGQSRTAALQCVRKFTSTRKLSKQNADTFEEFFQSSKRMLEEFRKVLKH